MQTDKAASPVLVAVVNEFAKKAEKAIASSDERMAVIELEQAGDSAKAAAEADSWRVVGYPGRGPRCPYGDLRREGRARPLTFRRDRRQQDRAWPMDRSLLPRLQSTTLARSR